jgi:putative alpha-1,2-mannosidase
MATKYKNGPAGIDGNDDCGTLSAWYVFSALGLYPLAGSDLYFVGAPTFRRAVLHLPGGDLVVKTDIDPARAPYTRRVTINGRELKSYWLRHREIVRGGEIVFELSVKPEGFSAPGVAQALPDPGTKEE